MPERTFETLGIWRQYSLAKADYAGNLFFHGMFGLSIDSVT
jgi:hypothetical protein